MCKCTGVFQSPQGITGPLNLKPWRSPPEKSTIPVLMVPPSWFSITAFPSLGCMTVSLLRLGQESLPSFCYPQRYFSHLVLSTLELGGPSNSEPETLASKLLKNMCEETLSFLYEGGLGMICLEVKVNHILSFHCNRKKNKGDSPP